MIISLTIIIAIITYLQFVLFRDFDNKLKFTPFLFIVIIFSFWEFFVLFLYGLNVDYLVLNAFFLISYASVIIFELFYFINLIKKEGLLRKKKSFLKHSIYLFCMLFFAIILLFFHKEMLPVESDNLYYEYLMNVAHRGGIYSLPKNTSESFILYSYVGLYQFGASFSYAQNMLLMPYFTTFIFIYFIFTALYFILDRFLKKFYLVILSFIFFTIAFIVFIVFFNYSFYWSTIVGNFSTSALLAVLFIPSFFIKNKRIHLENLITAFGFLFLNETSVLVLPVYLFSYLVFFTITRKRNFFSLSYFLIFFIFLLFSIYMIMFQILYVKYGFSITIDVIRFLPLIFIISLLLISFIFISNKYKNNKIFYWIYNIEMIKTISYFYNKTWFYKDNWFLIKQKKIYIFQLFFKIAFCVITIISLFATLTFIDYTEKNNWQLIHVDIFLEVLFSLLSIKIIFSNYKDNDFSMYFICLNIIVAIVGYYFYHNNLYSNITDRYFFISLFIFKGNIAVLKNIVLLVVFYFSTSWWKEKYIYIKKHYRESKKIKFNFQKILYLSFSSIYTVTTFSNILIESSTWEPVNKYFTLQSIQNNYLGGLEYKTINQLEKFNFNDKYIFSDIPIPIFNNTGKTLVDHFVYGLYWQSEFFFSTWKTFFTIQGKLIDVNAYNLKNYWLPYFSYVILRTSDSFALNIIYSLKQFKVAEKINNQLIIFENTNVDYKLQNELAKSNNYQIF